MASKEPKTAQKAPEKVKAAPEVEIAAPEEELTPAVPLYIPGKQPPPPVQRRQMRRLQASIGNRAVLRRIIQRGKDDTAGPNPLPVMMPWTAGAMSDVQTVRMEAERMLNETFGGAIKTISTEAGMNVTELDQDGLKTEYAKKKAEQDGKTSPADIDEYVKNRNTIYPGTLAGFAFKSRNTVYIDKAASKTDRVVTLVHEMLHMNAAGDWAGTVKADIDEGTTEMLTQKASAKLSGAKKYYAAQVGIVQKLIPVVGEGTLTSAYFGGAGILVAAVDTIIGEGTFTKLVNRITDTEVVGTFEDKIGKLLDPKKATWLRQKIDEMKGLLGGWVSDEDIARIRAIRSTLEQTDMTQVREELYPLVNSLWSDRQKGMMIEILS